MSTYIKDMGLFTISNGATASNIIQGFEDAECVYIWSMQSGAYTGTITVSVVSTDSTATGTSNSRADLTSGGSDVTIAAGNSVPITDTCFRGLMVYSSGAEAVDRQFRVLARFRVGR